MLILLTLFTFFNCTGARLRHGEVEDARGCHAEVLEKFQVGSILVNISL